MPTDSPPTEPALTFCIGCGYMLRQLPVNRCPECGRAFDPADPRTMSLGRPLRSWQRRLLRPIGWPTILLALLGTGGLAYLSDRPHLQLEPWSVLHDEFRSPIQIPRPPTAPDWVFYGVGGLWLAFIVLVLARQLAQFLVPKVARRANRPGSTSLHRRYALACAIIVTGFCMIFGWQQRIGRRWMARVSTSQPARLTWLDPDSDASGKPLFQFSADEGHSILRNLVRDLPTARQRMFALKVLVESTGRPALPDLIRAAANENDTDVFAWELRLIALCRDPATAPLFITRLQDPRADIRAAAADALGILRHPTYSVQVPDGWWIGQPLALDSTPPIILGNLLSKPVPPDLWSPGYAQHELLDDPQIAQDPSVRPILQRMMTTGVSVQEREAAARALVEWPPDNFTLRVAEWGVWIDSGGQLALSRSILDEIPPFVHQTGNPTNSFDNYFHYPSMVTKPVVHLTSDTTLAADVEVHIRHGRPWFAYPLPDDFGVGDQNETRFSGAIGGASVDRSTGTPASTSPSPPDGIHAPALKPLSDCREGYPWLIPHHRLREAGGLGYSFGMIYDLGLRWQSLIISPQQLPWMTPPTVPADPRFHWWARLREVPGSWISNRGETDRFLYYDGPTRSAVPMAVALNASDRRLKFTTAAPEESDKYPRERSKHFFEPMGAISRADLPQYEGFYIDVLAGVARGQHVLVEPGRTAGLETNLPLQGDPLIQRFREMLITYGLTAEEAEGLIAAWTPQFFQTDGRRFVLRMSPADYARQCPMQVRPRPTEVVRLGLILTEFDAPVETGERGASLPDKR